MATSHMYLISISEDGAEASPFHNAPLEILISQSSFSISIVIIFFNIVWFYIIFFIIQAYISHRMFYKELFIWKLFFAI